jgi:hypothetical protein
MNNIYKLMAEPMSGEEIKNLLNNDVKIMTYKELNNYNNIDDIFKESDNIALLYELKPKYGHWVGLINQPLFNRIEYFDSYGYIPDYHKKSIDKNFLIQSGQYKNLLSKLLYNTNKTIHYNEIPFQLKKNIISTCGRHICMRIMCRHLTLEQYQKIVLHKNKKTADILSVIITTYKKNNII